MPTDPILTWCGIGERYPERADELDLFLALEGDVEVGGVRFIGSGVHAGSWAWALKLANPAPGFNRPIDGMTPTAREAAHELLDCYTAFRKWVAEGEGQ